MYGVWNTIKKEFQFGIREENQNKAIKKLFQKIGNDAYKWRFEIRKIPEQNKKTSFRKLMIDLQKEVLL